MLFFDSGGAPGLIAYDGDEPIGWCAVAPRSDLLRLTTSRVLKPIDDEPVWSITCFLIKKSHRRRGVSVALLRAAGGFRAGAGRQNSRGLSDRADQEPLSGRLCVDRLCGKRFERPAFRRKLADPHTRPIMRRAL